MFCFGLIIASFGRDRIAVIFSGKEIAIIWAGAFLLAFPLSYLVARPLGLIWIEVLANEASQRPLLAHSGEFFTAVQAAAPILAGLVSFGPLTIFTHKLLSDIWSLFANKRP